MGTSEEEVHIGTGGDPEGTNVPIHVRVLENADTQPTTALQVAFADLFDPEQTPSFSTFFAKLDDISKFNFEVAVANIQQKFDLERRMIDDQDLKVELTHVKELAELFRKIWRLIIADLRKAEVDHSYQPILARSRNIKALCQSFLKIEIAKPPTIFVPEAKMGWAKNVAKRFASLLYAEIQEGWGHLDNVREAMEFHTRPSAK